MGEPGLEDGAPRAADPEAHRWTRENLRVLWSVGSVLSLGIVGPGILPMPYAFAQTGAVLGTILAVIIAWMNYYTCAMLVRGAQYTGARSYLAFSEAVGGRVYRFITEFFVAILMIGTVVGGIVQTGQAGSTGLEMGFNERAPSWLTYRTGMAIVVFYTLCVILPCCIPREVRVLDYVATVATLSIWYLMFVCIVQSAKRGLPALKDGRFAKVNQGSAYDVANSASLFFFSFYLQPIMMPLLSEVPAGRTGAKIMNTAAVIAIFFVALFTYVITGVFASMSYGYDEGDGNVLDQQWFGSQRTLSDGTARYTNAGGQFVLCLVFTFYLPSAAPPIVHSACQPFDSWFSSTFKERYTRLSETARRVVCVVVILAISLGIALGAPDNSGTIITVTGAAGSVAVSFVIPVLSHLALCFGCARCQREAAAADQLDDPSAHGSACSIDDKRRDSDSMLSDDSFKGDGPSLEMTGVEACGVDAPRFEPPARRLDASVQKRSVAGGAGYVTHDAPFAHEHAELVEDEDGGADGSPRVLQRTDTATTAMTTIGLFRVPRSYRTPNYSFWRFWAMEVALPTVVAIVGVVDGITALALLKNTIS